MRALQVILHLRQILDALFGDKIVFVAIPGVHVIARGKYNFKFFILRGRTFVLDSNFTPIYAKRLEKSIN